MAGTFAAPARAETRYALQVNQPKPFKAVYSFEIETPKLKAERWTVYLADPPRLPWQTEVSTRLTPSGDRYEDLSPRKRPLWCVRLPVRDPAQEHHFHGQVEYRAMLAGRQLIEHKAGQATSAVAKVTIANLTAEERTHSLADSKLIDFRDDKFQKWLDEHDLRRRPQGSTIDFSRRVFSYLKRTMQYEYLGDMDRRATHVCRAGRSDCGGMSSLFVAILRANNIPARAMAGRWASNAKPPASDVASQYQQISHSQQVHVKAEFFVDEVGWIPVDLSSGVLHDHSTDGLRYFGRDPGDFFVLHIDPCVEVETPTFGRATFDWLQTFHYYVNGKGELKDSAIKGSWRVEAVEGKK